LAFEDELSRGEDLADAGEVVAAEEGFEGGSVGGGDGDEVEAGAFAEGATVRGECSGARDVGQVDGRAEAVRGEGHLGQ